MVVARFDNFSKVVKSYSESVTQKGTVQMGSPAFDANKYYKAFIHFRNLDNIVARIDKLEKAGKAREMQ